MRKGVQARIVGVSVLSALAVAVIGLSAADAESPVEIKNPFPTNSRAPKPPLNDDDGANRPAPPPGEDNEGFEGDDQGDRWGEE